MYAAVPCVDSLLQQIQAVPALPAAMQLHSIFLKVPQHSSVEDAIAHLQAYEYMSYVVFHLGSASTELTISNNCGQADLYLRMIGAIRFSAALQMAASANKLALRQLHPSAKWNALHLSNKTITLRDVSTPGENFPLYIVCDLDVACDSLVQGWKSSQHVVMTSQPRDAQFSRAERSAVDLLTVLSADTFFGVAGAPFSELVASFRTSRQRRTVLLRKGGSSDAYLNCTNISSLQRKDMNDVEPLASLSKVFFHLPLAS